MPATIGLIDDKKKSLLQIKLYQWRNNSRRIGFTDNAIKIQRAVRNYILRKKVNFFTNLAKKYYKGLLLNAAKINILNNNLKKILNRRFIDKLKNLRKNKVSLTSLYNNLLKANDNLKSQNKNLFIKKIIKLYTFVVLKKLFNTLNKAYKDQSKDVLYSFWNTLKNNLLKKKEYSYANKLSNENKSVSKKLKFTSKKSSDSIKDKNTHLIQYMTLVPHLMKYLDGKIKERKNIFYQKLKNNYRNKKLFSSLNNYLNGKLNPDKKYFFEIMKKSASSGQMQKKLYKLLRRRIIKKLFSTIEQPSRLLKLMYLIKISIVNKEIAEKRWIRVLIRKWRFISFSKNISKKKMAFLYKHLHVNYLEMVNDVFGEEERNNPSVIKEFERFGANVGMWENEHPDFVEESNFCKNVQKRFSFHAPGMQAPKTQVKKIQEVKEEEMVEKKEIKEIQKYDKKGYKKKERKEEDKKQEDKKQEDKKEDKKEGEKDGQGKVGPTRKRYFRKSV